MRIIQWAPDEMTWPYDGGQPSFTTKPLTSYTNTVKVDPFPCYAHNSDTVSKIAEAVEAAFPIEFKPALYLLPCESIDRCNGWASKEDIWAEKDGKWQRSGWEPYIVLSGKRIPLHPAMTRYLVPHEYGHIVNWWIEYKRGLESQGLDKEYAALRGIEPSRRYGGTHWHTNIGEIIANDFRVCVTGLEAEFWPHPEIAHPSEVPAVQEFWKQAVKDFGVN